MDEDRGEFRVILFQLRQGAGQEVGKSEDLPQSLKAFLASNRGGSFAGQAPPSNKQPLLQKAHFYVRDKFKATWGDFKTQFPDEAKPRLSLEQGYRKFMNAQLASHSLFDEGSSCAAKKWEHHINAGHKAWRGLTADERAGQKKSKRVRPAKSPRQLEEEQEKAEEEEEAEEEVLEELNAEEFQNEEEKQNKEEVEEGP